MIALALAVALLAAFLVRNTRRYSRYRRWRLDTSKWLYQVELGQMVDDLATPRSREVPTWPKM